MSDFTPPWGAEFSSDRKYRYRLWRYWREDLAPVMWIMLNPSTADESRNDPTINRVIAFSMNWGYGGCLIHNLFAWRSTNPGGLALAKDPVGDKTNELMIEDGAKGYKIVCAWGNVWKGLEWRARDVREFMKGLDLNYLKLNFSGQPGHPLYLPGNSRPVKWED